MFEKIAASIVDIHQQSFDSAIKQYENSLELLQNGFMFKTVPAEEGNFPFISNQSPI